MPRRGSAYVSPVSSSSDSSSSNDDEEIIAVARQRSQWRRRHPALSTSSSSSDSSSMDESVATNDEDTDALEDFVDRRNSNHQSVAKLERLRRIFLNKPPRPKVKKARKKTPQDNQETHSATTSNSSGESLGGRRPIEDTQTTISLAIGHHVAALRDQVQRLARHHDAYAPQWQAVLTQAIDELTFVKQQEERALQSHVRMLHESYALRLELFEQQYRAKVAEINDAMRIEIAQQTTQSEVAVVAVAQRLQQQTQQLFHTADETSPNKGAELPLTENAQKKSVLLAKTAAFLDRQRIREDARRRRLAGDAPPTTPPLAKTEERLSPVTRQRAKLRVLEQMLATFSPATVDRVVRTVEQHQSTSTSATTPSTPAQHHRSLQPTPLSPRRRRQSVWHNGISREDPRGKELASVPPQPLLSRRFLLPEEEQELRTLRNSIGLAKDWMDDHALR